MGLGSSTNHRYQCGLWDNMDYGSLSKMSNPEPFSISDILQLLRAREIIEECVLSRTLHKLQLLYTTLPALLTKDKFFHRLQPSLTLAAAILSLALPLSTAHAPLCSSIFPTSPSHVCSSVVAFAQTGLHSNMHCNR